MIYVSQQHRALVLPRDPKLLRLFPHARAMGEQIVVPHGVEETRLLRNINIQAPSPILSDYDWARTVPFEAQRATAAMMVVNPRAYILSEMGTGKTRAALFAMDYLMQRGVIKHGLIIAPLSTLTQVWEGEIFRFFPHRKAVVVWGDREKRAKRLAEPADFYIINHDGVHVMLSELTKRTDIDAIVVDEISAFRNHRSRMHKALQLVIRDRKYVWGTTGSPTPNQPTDAYGIARLLTPNRVPKFYTHFRDRTMQQISRFKWIPRAGSTEIVHQALQPSVRFLLDEVKELPPTSYLYRTVPQEAPAEKLYEGLKARMREMVAHTAITAVNEGVLYSKLLQVSCGYVYDDKKATVLVPNAPRMAALIETLESTDRKVLVFVPFIHACEGVAKALLNSGYDAAMINGSTSKGERDRVFAAFQHASNIRVIVAHPETMAHGLTLTAANTIVWFSPTTSFEIYEQANARIRRPGQDVRTIVMHLQSTGADRNAYARLRKRQSMQGALLSLFNGVEEDT